MIRWSKVNNTGITIQSRDDIVGWRSEADHVDGWGFGAVWSRTELDHVRYHTSLLKTMYNLKLTNR